MTSFGDALRKARKISGMTLAELGSVVGISAGYVCDMEAGRRGPPAMNTVARMADAMGAPVTLLVMIALHERYDEAELDVIRDYYQGCLR